MGGGMLLLGAGPRSSHPVSRLVQASGTSVAAASVTGLVLLMQEYYWKRTGELPPVALLESWLRESATTVFDGDDEDDNGGHRVEEAFDQHVDPDPWDTTFDDESPHPTDRFDPDKPDALPMEMIERAERAGVRFLGMRKDMEDLYSAMDLFILPSHREGFPRAAMEAAAMGLPVVATDIRGCRQVVRHRTNGLLIPVRDPASIREAIRSLGEDPAARAEMSRASREIAIAEFDEKKVVAIVIETYCQVLQAKGLGHLIPEAWAEPDQGR